jgi:hypothetical protein
MEKAHGVVTLLDDTVKLDLIENNTRENAVDSKQFQAFVGSLIYVALATRPDIFFAVAALSRYNSRPFTSHLTAAKRVLLSRVYRLEVLGVIINKLRFGIASIATRTRDSKSRITEVNRGDSKAN